MTNGLVTKVGNASANAFPLLLLAGSSETHLVTKGAFQELDAISLLAPHCKLVVRPSSIEAIAPAMRSVYRHSFYGRPGTTFIDLPADIIQGTAKLPEEVPDTNMLPHPPKTGADENKILEIARLLKAAKAPLIVIGKGAAYAQAESSIRGLIDRTSIPFLPSPMGKGVVADSHATNTASARSTALRHVDVVLMLGARLNWIFHFGEPPKWNPKARFIQVDICAEEVGSNGGDAELGIVGDVNIVVPQLIDCLSGWRYDLSTSEFGRELSKAKAKNEAKASAAASRATLPLSYSHAFAVIKSVLHSFSPPDAGGIVYVSEGANTMDISRSAFPVEHPRLRLDAGTYATMGVGLGYAIAAHEAYNGHAAEASSGPARRKKVVALEGDSAFGFSAMEVETMARYKMDILIFVMNNSGVYHGDAESEEEWLRRQAKSLGDGAGEKSLRSTSLGWQTGYEKIAEACGGRGFLVRTADELEKATREGFKSRVPVVVNVIIESGAGAKLVS